MKPLPLCALALVAFACGNKIGDSCSIASDCSSDGDRICDFASPGGYCTVEACDYGTCPEESTCVRFFPVSQLSTPCSSDLECAIDELCVTGGKCAPRSTERRFCMLTCGDHSDCREHYECRGEARMGAHGGEPVPDPNATTEGKPTTFCASSMPCLTDADCDLGDTCNEAERYCER